MVFITEIDSSDENAEIEEIDHENAKTSPSDGEEVDTNCSIQRIHLIFSKFQIFFLKIIQKTKICDITWKNARTMMH